MKEGTVPTPPYHTCGERDDDVVPVQGVIAFGGSPSSGSETPVSVQVFKNHFSRVGRFPFFLRIILVRRERDLLFF